MRSLLVAVPAILIAAAVIANAGGGGGAEVGWKTNLSAALAQAKREHKLVLVDFNATWCPPCKQYKSDVFPTRDFKAATKHYILVNIDVDKQNALAEKYKINPIPDIRVLTPTGKQLGQVIGYDPNGLFALLKRSLGRK